MNELLPGLTTDGASLLLSLAQKGIQAMLAEAQVAGGALDAAISAAKAQEAAANQPTQGQTK